MRILSYLQARSRFVDSEKDELVQRALMISGRVEEFLEPVIKALKTHPELGDIQIVESSQIGRKVLKMIPREEWLFLVNPSLADKDSRVVVEGIVSEGRIFSLAFAKWLEAQEYGHIYKLSNKDFTSEQARIVLALWQKQDTIVERDEIACLMWGETWNEKYSDWGIDALMYRLRAKIGGRWQVVTIKGRGYMLAMTSGPTKAPQVALNRNIRVQEIPASIYPTDEYNNYMNDPKKSKESLPRLIQSNEK